MINGSLPITAPIFYYGSWFQTQFFSYFFGTTNINEAPSTIPDDTGMMHMIDSFNF
jgi:hypothetical protein